MVKTMNSSARLGHSNCSFPFFWLCVNIMRDDNLSHLRSLVKILSDLDVDMQKSHWNTLNAI